MLNQMRLRSLELHTSHRGLLLPTNRRPARDGFVRFLARKREVHKQLDVGLPLTAKPQRDFVTDIEVDLWSLEYSPDAPPAVPDPFPCEYAEYLKTLSQARLACHFYNVVFAQLVGGGLVVAREAAPVLPHKWLDVESQYFRPSATEAVVLRLRHDLEELGATWTQAERDACLAETPDAFFWGLRLNEEMFRP